MRKFIKRFLADDPDARVLQAAGIVRFVFVFLQGVILVKAGVALELVGQIELVFFLVNFLTFYLENGGRNAMISWVPVEKGQFGQRLASVFGGMHILGMAAGLIAFAYLGIPNAPGYDFLQTDTASVLIMLIVFASVPNSALTYNYQLTGRRERILPWIAVSFALQLGAVVIPVLMGHGLEAVLFWLALVAIGRWVFAVADGRWFSGGKVSLQGSLVYLGFALPLMFHALNSGLMDYVDGWIVTGYFGEDMFARYRYGARELPINALLIGGLVSGLIPRFSKNGVVDAPIVRAETTRLIKAIVPANCLLLLISPLLYEIVYSEEFILSARIFNIYALTLISRVIIGQVYLYVFQKSWVLALSTLVEIIINVSLSLVLLEWIGLLGIPMATVIAFGFHKVFITIYVGRKLGSPLTSYIPVKVYVFASLALLLSFIIAEYIYF